jgi:hypothetical protein
VTEPSIKVLQISHNTAADQIPHCKKGHHTVLHSFVTPRTATASAKGFVIVVRRRGCTPS